MIRQIFCTIPSKLDLLTATSGGPLHKTKGKLYVLAFSLLTFVTLERLT